MCYVLPLFIIDVLPVRAAGGYKSVGAAPQAQPASSAASAAVTGSSVQVTQKGKKGLMARDHMFTPRGGTTGE